MGEQLSAAPPDVFDDYFEQDVKVGGIFDLLHICKRSKIYFVTDMRGVMIIMMLQAVHLSQRGVIKACLPENKWTKLLEK